MGLLEKALQYKKEMNSKGQDTLIDRIQGPAETGFPEDESDTRFAREAAEPGSRIEPDILELKENDLFELPSDREERGVREKSGEPEEPEKAVADAASDDFNLDEEPASGVSARAMERREASPDPLGPDDLPPPLKGESAERPDATPMEPPPVKVVGESASEMEVFEGYEEEPFIDMERDGVLPTREDRSAKGMRILEEIADRVESSSRRGKRFHDFMVLYEIGKEIVKAETRTDLYDVVLFSIMGQIGVSSSSILIPDPSDSRRWLIADSRGISIKNPTMLFDTSAGILGTIFKRREIIDLDAYKNSAEHADEYFKLVSIDARLVSPLSYDKNIYGAVVLGEKITIGDYTDAEKDFILSISEIAAVALARINAIESNADEARRYRSEADLWKRIDDFRTELLSHADPRSAENMTKALMQQAGVEVYAVFLKNEKEKAYIPLVVDPGDSLGIGASSFRIAFDHPLAIKLRESKSPLRIEDISPFDSIQSVFTEAQLRKMNVFYIDPYCVGQDLKGFFGAFRLSDTLVSADVGGFLEKLSRVLVPGLQEILDVSAAGGKFVDAVEPSMRRVVAAFEHAKSVGVPMTLVHFSIKNFKRFHNLYGAEESRELLSRCEQVIVSRLSDSDFSVRFDRSKFMLVLPGKNKKFAIPLANSIRNEITQLLKKREMQLMLVYLTAEFPEDGDDLHTLLDSIESV
jgi:GAF domain-containing protein